MVPIPVKLLLFIAANAIGFYAALLAGNIAIVMKAYPDIADSAGQMHAHHLILGGTMWVWIASAVISLGVFLGDTKKRLLLLLLPLLAPTLYLTGAIAWVKMHAGA
jgi:hypothetical protein